VESWQFQLDGLADRYRLIAFDNRGAGRTAMPEAPATVEAMADDAAGVLRALGVTSAHVAGFSGGSIISQELALPIRTSYAASCCRAPGWRRTLPPPLGCVRPLAGRGRPERTGVPGVVLPLDLYAARHNDGTVDEFIEEVLAFPHRQAPEDVQRFLDAFFAREDPSDRLPEVAAPTLVLAGGRDQTMRPEICQAVAELIPDAQFEVIEQEAHQPFQEIPDEWNARVDAFWREVEGARTP